MLGAADGGPNLGGSSRPPWTHADRRGGAETRRAAPYERPAHLDGISAAGNAATRPSQIVCWVPRMVDLILGVHDDPPGKPRNAADGSRGRHTSRTSPASDLPRWWRGGRRRTIPPDSSSWPTRMADLFVVGHKDLHGTPRNAGDSVGGRRTSRTSPAPDLTCRRHGCAAAPFHWLLPRASTRDRSPAPVSRLKTPLDPCEDGR